MASLGKQFEQKVKEDFVKVEGATIDRLYDVTSGYRTISNIADFIAYHYPNIFYLECKTHAGNTFPLEKLTQYDKLVQKVGIKGVRTGVVLWLYDHEDCIVYIPISTVTKLKEDGKKSFNVKMVGDSNYPSIKLPSVKRRTFYDTDYSALMDLPEGW